ncbi:hypothetical protein BsWGS_11559 [Bradybaena similaris]
MELISRSELLLCIGVCLLPYIRGTHYPDYIYGDSPCGASYTVSKDSMFTFVKTVWIQISPNCTTTFRATNGAKLKATFQSYTVDSIAVNENGNCSTEFIQFYNSSGSPLIGPAAEYCGSQMPASQYVLGVEGKFTRMFKESLILTVSSVQILLTEFVDKNNSCAAGYFDCENNYCVNNEVTCNGYDDCGNNKDEEDSCGLSPGAVSGIVVGSVVLFPLLVYLICVFAAKNKRRGGHYFSFVA